LFDGQRNRAEHMLDPLSTGAVLYERGDFKLLARYLREETLWLLGPEAVRTFDNIAEQLPPSLSSAFPDSGVYVMNASDRQIVIDAGPLGAGSGGHGHADALSICVSNKNGPVLIDSGTFEYVGDGEERNQYRSTAAHNTLTIDGVSQPEPRGPFAWSHHPKSATQKWINGELFGLFIGSHDAYSPIMHRRFVFSRKLGFWFVRDLVEGIGEHRVDAYWHFAPEWTASDGARFSRSEGQVLDVVSPQQGGWVQHVENGTWSPVYGEAQRSPVLHFGTVATLPTDFATLFLSRGNASVRPGTLNVIGDTSGVRAYVYSDADEEHRFFFATANRDWAVDGWSSDAEFVYWGYERTLDRALLVLCGGTKVNAAGQAIAECSNQGSFCEVLWENGSAQVLRRGDSEITIHDSALRSVTTEPALSALVRQQAGK
jgi:hypothetical protein